MSKRFADELRELQRDSGSAERRLKDEVHQKMVRERVYQIKTLCRQQAQKGKNVLEGCFGQVCNYDEYDFFTSTDSVIRTAKKEEPWDRPQFRKESRGQDTSFLEEVKAELLQEGFRSVEYGERPVKYGLFKYVYVDWLKVTW